VGARHRRRARADHERAILGEAAWNRSGEATATLELTERELAMPLYREKDDTGSCSRSSRRTGRLPRSCSRASSAARSFVGSGTSGSTPRSSASSDSIPRDGGRRSSDAHGHGPAAGSLPRVAFVVVENGGDAWRAWLAAREDEVEALRARVGQGLESPEKLAEAEALLAIDRTSRSRLMPVDAGLDPDASGAVPDRSRHACFLR